MVSRPLVRNRHLNSSSNRDRPIALLTRLIFLGVGLGVIVGSILKTIVHGEKYGQSQLPNWFSFKALTKTSANTHGTKLPQGFINKDPVELMMYYDTINYLPNDILTKVDRAAMAVGLETRAPFLDPLVAKTAWSLPLQYKIRKKER